MKVQDQTGPLTIWQFWKKTFRPLLKWTVTGLSVGIFFSVLRASPEEWAVSIGNWTLWFREWAHVAIPVIICAIIARLSVKLWEEYTALREEYTAEVSGKPKQNETGKHPRSPYEFYSLFDIRERVKAIFREFSETDELKEIKVIAATGASIIPMFKEYIGSGRPIGNTLFRVLIMDPNGDQISKAAEHWKYEAQSCIEKTLPILQGEAQGREKRIQFDRRTYNFLPCVQGLLFGEKYLFISWMEWSRVRGKLELRGAERPFSYFEKDDENAERFFKLFQSWFDYAWGASV